MTKLSHNCGTVQGFNVHLSDTSTVYYRFMLIMQSKRWLSVKKNSLTLLTSFTKERFAMKLWPLVWKPADSWLSTAHVCPSWLYSNMGGEGNSDSCWFFTEVPCLETLKLSKVTTTPTLHAVRLVSHTHTLIFTWFHCVGVCVCTLEFWGLRKTSQRETSENFLLTMFSIL